MISKNKKFIAVLLISLFLISAVAVGCTPQRRPEPAPAPGAPGAPGAPADPDFQTPPGQPGMDPRTGPQADANRRAERLAQMIADRIDEVEGASVVFSEQIVYVGLDVDQQISQSRARDIERQIGEMVMEEEPNVDRVYVSMDPETFERLQGVARGIEEGRPLSGFLTEVEEWFRRITPTRR